MPRPLWDPSNEEHRRAIAALDQALVHAEAERVRAKEIIDAATEQVWAAARAARAVGISATFIATKTGVDRRTVHRHVPPSGRAET